MTPPSLTGSQWLAVAVSGFVVYNSVVIVCEMRKPASRVCGKCAITRIVLGAALGAYAVSSAFSNPFSRGEA
jgi:hypothetical protein